MVGNVVWENPSPYMNISIVYGEGCDYDYGGSS